MRIVFMGTPEFSIPTLRRLMASDHEVVAVYTQPDRATGRGRILTPPPAKRVAVDQGLPVFQPVSLRAESEVERLARLKPDAIIVVAFGQMLTQEVLDIPGFGCLNVHPSLLPGYRGASPIASALLNGDEETGVTIMLMDAGMDAGPILSQKRVSIDPADTAESLGAKLAESGADLLEETLPAWFDRRLRPQPQDDKFATYTKPISKSDGEIDWHLTALELERRVRAFYPWPGCYTRWQGRVLKVLEATVISSEDMVEPGIVVLVSSDPDTPMGVGTREGILGLRKVQLEGKRAVSAVEFLRGQSKFIGQRLG